MNYCFRFSLLIGLLAMILLAAPLTAQEEGPAPVGLRPDAPTYALHGPYWVGTIGFSMETPSHVAPANVWYPALNPDGEVEETMYAWSETFASPILGHAIKDAVPNTIDGPYPLVVFSHGWQGTGVISPYLVEHLASHGFVVMAIDHGDSPNIVDPIPFHLLLVTRPRDITAVIDNAMSLTVEGGMLEEMIDIEHVGVVGHSLGGYTALAAGGARFDMDALRVMCGELQPDVPEVVKTVFCGDVPDHESELATLAGFDLVPQGLWPSWRDERIQAVVSLAGSPLFREEGLNELKVPLLAIVGSIDSGGYGYTGTLEAFQWSGSPQKSLVVLNGAEHLVYNLPCADAPWLLALDLHAACSDPIWDMDRAHDLIDHFTAAFLHDVLYGNEDTHTTLLPENVYFPGITYEAEGF